MDNIKTDLGDNGILRITLSRPERLNALSFQTLAELEQSFIQAQSDSKTKAILITGEGKAFCAGADIKELAELDARKGYEFARKGQRIFGLLETLGKPSLCAVNGFAFGGGCELSAAATLRIASSNAQFGQPEVKLGVIPGYGGTQRLARLIGKGRALDLCLTSRFIKADEALQFGLVSEVTSPEELLPRAEAILENITKMGPLAVKSTMEVIHSGYDLPLNDALQLEATHFALSCATRDKQEGVNAFLEKREPVFSGE